VKQPYVRPTVSVHRVELEEWIATSPEVENAISTNSIDWGKEDIRLGGAPATEGGDIYFPW
jgi:hypothetical protein